MKSKKYIKIFLSLIILGFIVVVLLNIVVNPFGLFENKFFSWRSYEMTQNPRIAKVEYLKDKEFDSFVVGASGSSSFPIEDLEKNIGGNFYNLFYYGADMKDSVDTVKHLIKTQKVKNIFLPLGITSAAYYDVGNEKMNNRMHCEVDKSSSIKFYAKYLFANPNYAIDKIKSSKKDSYLQKSFDVFNPITGTYDKSLRDIEPIGDLDEYLEREKYKEFNTDTRYHQGLNYIDEFIASVEEIKELCDENDITLYVLMCPIYYDNFDRYDNNEVKELYTRLANTTEFWDFTKTSISYDARYFYDKTHWRNSVGSMMIAKMFGNNDIYIPKNFGELIDSKNVEERIKIFDKDLDIIKDDYEVKIPVLLYHHIDKKGDDFAVISEENFKKQMEFISKNNYHSLTTKEILDYVNKGTKLPEKSFLLTFDDGYLSNYEIAYPILKGLGLNAIVFPIGHSVGKNTYKDTGVDIFPHFNIEEAKKMYDDGVFDLGSHTFDMHMSESLENSPTIRTNSMPLENESEKDFIKAFNNDFDKENEIIKKITKHDIEAYAYPGGFYSDLTAVLLSEKGVKMTFLTTVKVNTIIKGLPQSLLGLSRYNMTDNADMDEVKNFLDGIY